MKTNIEHGVFYVNEVTNERVAFNHAFPVCFSKERAQEFIKEMNYNRWYSGGSSLPKDWIMQAIPLDITH